MDAAAKSRGDGGGDGREAATSPGTDARSPQKLEEVGRGLPWSLWTELSPETPWPQTCGFQDSGMIDSNYFNMSSLCHL